MNLTVKIFFTAIKKISFPHFDESQESYDKLLHEVYTLSQLSHPNIVKYYHSWIEFEERKQAIVGTDLSEDTHHSFMIQLPNPTRCSSNLIVDDTSLSESIDSSITAITFTEVKKNIKKQKKTANSTFSYLTQYALTSDTDNFDDDPTDEATDDFATDNFPFGEDVSCKTKENIKILILNFLFSSNVQLV